MEINIGVEESYIYNWKGVTKIDTKFREYKINLKSSLFYCFVSANEPFACALTGFP